ncbi:MAG TPA: hypothetical protein VF221_00185, partial [Chloroflexota bacterium]
MNRRLFVVVAAACLLVAAIAASNALATQAYRDLTGGYQGSRATIDNPDSSQAYVSAHDLLLSSAYADDGANGSFLIQVGPTYEWLLPEGPSCNLGSVSPSLYFFTEIEQYGAYYCWNVGTTSFSTSHLQSVKH